MNSAGKDSAVSQDEIHPSLAPLILGRRPEVLDNGLLHALSRYAEAASLVIAGVGAAVLAGWFAAIPVLKSVLPGLPSMKANTAAAFLFAGLGLWLLHPARRSGRWAAAGAVMALVPLLVGILTLVEYFLDWNLGIDELLISDDVAALATSSPGRPSPITAAAFALIGCALVAMFRERPGRRQASQYLAVSALFLSSLGFLAYLYGATIIRSNPAYSSMALHTAVSFLVLSTAVLCAHPGRGMMRLLVTDNAGGLLARRLIPTVIGFSVALGWLRLQAQRLGYIDTEFGLVIMVTIISAFVTVATVIAARVIDRVDRARMAATDALRLWASVFEEAGWGVAVYSADGGALLRVNEAFAKMHGYTATELAGRPASDLYLNEHRTAEHSAVENAIAQGHQTVESLRRRKDGSTFPALVDLTQLRDAEKRPMALAANVQDVSILKLAEERAVAARRQVEAIGHRLALALRSGEIGVWEWDVRSNVLTWDEQMYHLYGIAPGSPVSYSTWTSTVLPEDLPAAEDTLRRMIEVKGISDNQFRINHPLLGIRHIAASEETVLDDSGAVVYVVGINTDITVAKLKEAELREREERLRLSFEHSAVGTAIVALDGKWIAVNRAMCEMVGYSRPDLLAIDFQTITHADDLEADLMLVRQLVAGEIPSYQLEKRYLHKDGHTVWVRISVALVRSNQGAPVHFVVHVEDITERKHAEDQASTARRELEAFSYSVAHDLRAPLRGINGFTQLLGSKLAKQQADDDIREYLRLIVDSSKRMGQLIDDLLSLSKVVRAELKRSAVDLSQMARVIAARLQNAAPDRSAEFIVQDGLVAQADERLMLIALENLLGNAWKYTSKNCRARIEFGAMRQGTRTTYFVRDDGDGFDMAYAGKLFGAFQRLHAASDFEGTGIGLATVQRIIRRHGGTVRGEGKVGAGATFYFTLD